MSTRTIIEINHDFHGDLKQHPKALQYFVEALSHASFRELREYWAPAGVTVLAQRHHSEDIAGAIAAYERLLQKERP